MKHSNTNKWQLLKELKDYIVFSSYDRWHYLEQFIFL